MSVPPRRPWPAAAIALGPRPRPRRLRPAHRLDPAPGQRPAPPTGRRARRAPRPRRRPVADVHRRQADPGHPRRRGREEGRRRRSPRRRSPPRTRSPCRATPTSASIGQTVDPQHPARHRPLPGRDRRVPQDHDEFMEKIIKANNIALPKLPFYQEYAYDADEHKLVIMEYPDRKGTRRIPLRPKSAARRAAEPADASEAPGRRGSGPRRDRRARRFLGEPGSLGRCGPTAGAGPTAAARPGAPGT